MRAERVSRLRSATRFRASTSRRPPSGHQTSCDPGLQRGAAPPDRSSGAALTESGRDACCVADAMACITRAAVRTRSSAPPLEIWSSRAGDCPKAWKAAAGMAHASLLMERAPIPPPVAALPRAPAWLMSLRYRVRSGAASSAVSREPDQHGRPRPKRPPVIGQLDEALERRRLRQAVQLGCVAK